MLDRLLPAAFKLFSHSNHNHHSFVGPKVFGSAMTLCLLGYLMSRTLESDDAAESVKYASYPLAVGALLGSVYFPSTWIESAITITGSLACGAAAYFALKSHWLAEGQFLSEESTPKINVAGTMGIALGATLFSSLSACR